jgi:hypothetical protein
MRDALVGSRAQKRCELWPSVLRAVTAVAAHDDVRPASGRAKAAVVVSGPSSRPTGRERAIHRAITPQCGARSMRDLGALYREHGIG